MKNTLRVGLKCLLRASSETTEGVICFIHSVSADGNTCNVRLESNNEHVTVESDKLRVVSYTKRSWNSNNYSKWHGNMENNNMQSASNYTPLVKTDGTEIATISEDDSHMQNSGGPQVDSGYETFNETAQSIAPPPQHAVQQAYVVPNLMAPRPTAYQYGSIWSDQVVNVPTIVGAVNFQARPSTRSDCADLPTGDLATLKFFFNLGIDAYNRRIQNAAENPDVEMTNQVSASMSDLKASESSTTSETTTENGNGNWNWNYANRNSGRNGSGYNRGGNRARGNGARGGNGGSVRGNSMRGRGSFGNNRNHGNNSPDESQSPSNPFAMPPPPPYYPQEQQFIPYMAPSPFMPPLYQYQYVPQPNVTATRLGPLVDYSSQPEMTSYVEPQPSYFVYPQSATPNVVYFVPPGQQPMVQSLTPQGSFQSN